MNITKYHVEATQHTSPTDTPAATVVMKLSLFRFWRKQQPDVIGLCINSMQKNSDVLQYYSIDVIQVNGTSYTKVKHRESHSKTKNNENK